MKNVIYILLTFVLCSPLCSAKEETPTTKVVETPVIVKPIFTGNCTTNANGEVSCGAGQCLTDSYGKVICNKDPGGGCIKDSHGEVVCGPGQCLTDSHGQVVCSKKPGGACAKNPYGEVICQ